MLKKISIVTFLILIIACNSSKKESEKEVKSSNIKTATLAYKTKAVLGEGAIWNYKTQELYWVDIEGKQLNVFNPKSKENKVLKTKSRIGTVVPFTKEEVLIALEDGVHKMNLNSGESALFTNMKNELPGSRLNDGKCDPAGRFWVGSMHFNQLKNKANLYTITSENTLVKKVDSVTISNGIVWTSDKKIMYYIDTPTSSIKAFDYDNKTGEITNGKVVVKIPESLGFPDGMTIDEENMLWVGMWNGNAVIRFNPINGKVISKIEVPAHNITSCAFGGENLDILYITSASVDMTPEEVKKYPLAGSVFKIKPGVKGVNSNFYIENKSTK
ncbi:SMP-30/gluconolactonase/LRE family protein [Polaribacter vadi]|uniref:SMP-30/gluconolactonase/LRE family protein n=1 Tax=Polaribacter TaxID=52959 RepID=UPI001C08E3C7|nr:MULTISPECIES: SMP-30/gluconolactonase/LRE family protein [Polaribacter]MBU3012828.1 SMP-30/gluconolactonase/LRE family protein [Polaribacter vadi]MDO6742644.1 SMP-30/gluconolactonase/LRE family protein [Polaribacter sp. 1_MG-2023]